MRGGGGPDPLEVDDEGADRPGDVIVTAEDGRRVRMPSKMYWRLLPEGWEDATLVLRVRRSFAMTTPWILGFATLGGAGLFALGYLAGHIT
jgi:hypothetical protein